MAFEPKELFDALADFPQGVNSGVAALKVPRDQQAYCQNVTVRGTFASNRPAYRKITLDYGGDTTLQTNVETSLWQGGCYYKPDFGPESLMAQIGGRLFQFQVSGTTATVFDRSIANDLNSATNSQAWLWQAEKWIIANDGQSLPVIFDGNSSRRSVGPASNINSLNANFTAPAIGSTAAATFLTAFSGPFNVPLFISTGASSSTKYLFQATGTAAFAGYAVTVKNLTDTPATVEATNSQVLIQNNVVGTVATSTAFFPTPNSTWTIFLTAPSTVPVGSSVSVFINHSQIQSDNTGETRIGTITAIGVENVYGWPITVVFPSPYPFGQVRISRQITTASGGTNTLVALLYSALTAPAINATTTAYFDRPYTGSLPQTVYINGKQYQITAVASITPSLTVTLLNINAPTTANLFPTGSIVSTVPELPAGRMGAYGLGRNWASLTDGRSFIAGDIVGGSSGLPAYSFRDAVLKVTENTYLLGGGMFVVPGQVGDIRAMIFVANLDKALGQGPMQVYTPNITFSCNAPVDRTTWQDITNPILSESMKGGGGESQNSTINANSDTLSRDKNGIRSLILARREFATWGNVPISREMQPTLDADDKSLLSFGSAIEFDNRAIQTANPTQSAFGVYHPKLIALNFDPISSLRGKAPSVYDGVWLDLNVLQLIVGSFNGKDRAFAFCVSADLTKIELWEILPSEGPDSATTDEGGVAIVWETQSGSLNFGQNDPRKRDLLRLMDGGIFVDSITSDVTFAAYYKPDQWPDWVPWYSWTEPFDPNSSPGFRPRMGLGEPDPKLADTSSNNRPLREAYTYQFRLVVTGHCRFLGARFKAITCPQPPFAPPKP